MNFRVLNLYMLYLQDSSILGNRHLIVGAWGAYNQELGPKELPHTTHPYMNPKQNTGFARCFASNLKHGSSASALGPLGIKL